MAKITVEMDTVEKTYSVKLDGKELDNVDCVSLYRQYPYSDSDDDGDKCCMSVSMVEADEDNGLRTHTRICASKSDDAKQYEKDGWEIAEIGDLPGYIMAKACEQPQPAAAPLPANDIDEKLQADITDFMTNQKKKRV